MKSISKIRHLQNTNIILENRYMSEKHNFFLNEGEGEGVSGTSVTPSKSDATNSFTKSDISNISTGIWDKVSSSPELKSHLGIEPHHTEHNFLEDVSHKIHGHVSPNGHMTVEFPGLGKTHNTTLVLGKSFASHGDSHGDSHGKTGGFEYMPHSSFDVGVKFNLGKSIGKKHK
jgi:hypothetical protein